MNKNTNEATQWFVNLVLYMLDIGLVWAIVWSVKPNIDSGLVWLIAILYATIMGSLTTIRQAVKNNA